MSLGWSTTAGNAALTSVTGTYSWVQLHTGDPGASGTANAATEATRKQATWGTAANGAITTTADLTWTSVAGSEDYTHFTVWSASTAGTFGFSGTITANAVVIGDTFIIPTGEFDLSLTLAS